MFKVLALFFFHLLIIGLAYDFGNGALYLHFDSFCTVPSRINLLHE
jgi:hypothetical protein